MNERREQEFFERMMQLYKVTRQEVYNPLRFLEMLGESRGRGTAQRLLDAPDKSDGFRRLWEAGRLDLTVEAVIIDEDWTDLFTPEQVATARQRLEDAGYL